MEQLVELKYDRFRLSDDEFYDFCSQNDSLKFERDSEGNIFIMPNTGGITGNLNSELTTEITIWNRINKLGKTFDSSTTFRLPNTAVRSADVAWVSIDRWNGLDIEDKIKFPPICPDFILELMSNSDNLKEAKRKMQDDWMVNGCKLGWLIDPKSQKVYIYRQNQDVEIINDFNQILSGEKVLEDFELDLKILI